MSAVLRSEQIRTRIIQIGLFAAVGVANTLIDLLLFLLLTQGFSLPIGLSNIVSFSVGALNGFVLNGRVTFKGALQNPATLSVATRYVIAILATLSISTVLVLLLSTHFSASVAKVISIGPVFAIGFLLSRNFVFRERRRGAPSA